MDLMDNLKCLPQWEKFYSPIRVYGEKIDKHESKQKTKAINITNVNTKYCCSCVLVFVFFTKGEIKSEANQYRFFFWETRLQKENSEKRNTMAWKLSLTDPVESPSLEQYELTYTVNQSYVIP